MKNSKQEDVCECCIYEEEDPENFRNKVEEAGSGEVRPSREDLREVNQIVQQLMGMIERCFRRCHILEDGEKCNKLCVREVDHEGECQCMKHNQEGIPVRIVLNEAESSEDIEDHHGMGIRDRPCVKMLRSKEREDQRKR